MSKKFTEEQYKKIIEEWENGPSYTKATKAVIDYLEYEDLGCIAYEALALANMATREWAHDQFVEKENKYVWTSKKANSSGRNKRLFWQASSKSVRDYFTIDANAFDDSEKLTELDIKEWGYNPEMFNKEEV